MKSRKIVGKKKCLCGRKVICARDSDGRLPYEKPICSTCKTLGLEESRRQYLQLYKVKVSKVEVVR